MDEAQRTWGVLKERAGEADLQSRVPTFLYFRLGQHEDDVIVQVMRRRGDDGVDIRK